MTESGQYESVGTLYAVTMDVNDLGTCAKFWSRVLGAEIKGIRRQLHIQ